MKRRARLLRALGAFALIAAAVFCYVKFGAPRVRDWRVESLLAKYSREPSERLSQRLVWLLDRQIATADQGWRIMTAVMTPRLCTREAYRVGKPAHFSLTRAFPIHFRNMSIDKEEVVETADDKSRGAGTGGNSMNARPRILRLHPTPSKTGEYHVTVRYRYALTPNRHKSTWSWSPMRRFPWCLLPVRHGHTWRDKGDPPVYTCAIVIPVVLKVVPVELAERVTTVSNPDLDRRIKKAFWTEASNCRYGYSTPLGPRSSTGGLRLRHSPLPVDAVFGVYFVRADGGEECLADQGWQMVRVRKGVEGSIDLPFDRLRIANPGTHTGVLVLRPSPEGAYYDPEIKEIWDGELRFPATMTVTTR